MGSDKEFQEDFTQLKKKLGKSLHKAKESGSIEAGKVLQSAIKNKLADNPTVTNFSSMFNRGRKSGRVTDNSAFAGFSNYTKYLVRNDGKDDDGVSVGFSFNKRVLFDSDFSLALEKIIENATRARTVRVTPKMRRYIAWKSKGKFALKKETTTLHYPARPIIQPVHDESNEEAISVFDDNFSKTIIEEFDK